VLGVVQGITELMPISSTAHIRIVPALLGYGPGIRLFGGYAARRIDGGHQLFLARRLGPHLRVVVGDRTPRLPRRSFIRTRCPFNADADDPSQQPNLGTPGAANHRPWLSSSYLDFGVEVDHAVRRQNKSGRELLALHQVAAPEPEPL
jgi:hypothetical protein